MRRNTVVITVSDSVSAGTRIDKSGPAVQQRLSELGWSAEIQVLPDDPGLLSKHLRDLADANVAAVFTTGGTGIAARDWTPEATRAVLDREIPGLAEWMRSEGLRFTRRALLSRGVVGTRGRTVIVNLPGSPQGAVQSLDSIADLLPHVVELLDGNTEHPGAPETTPDVRTSLK